MKLRKLTQRITAAILAGAMALSLSATALAGTAGISNFSASTPTLTVTYNGTTFTLYGTDSGVKFEDFPYSSGSVVWESNGLPKVSYTSSDGFVFTGSFNNAVTINGTGSEDVTLNGKNSAAVKGYLTMENVGDVTIEKTSNYDAILQSGAEINSSGAVAIQNSHSGDGQAAFAVRGNLKVTATSLDVLGTVLGDAEVTAGTVDMLCKNGAAITNKLEVNGAVSVTVTGRSRYGVIGDEGDIDHNHQDDSIANKGQLVLNGCSGVVTLSNTYRSPANRVICTNLANPITVDGNSTNAIKATCYVRTLDGTDWQQISTPQQSCKNTTYKALKIDLGGTYTLKLTRAKAYYNGVELKGTTVDDTTTYEVEHGKTLTLKAVKPNTTQHWAFDDWMQKSPSGWDYLRISNEEYTITVDKDITLQASWDPIYQIIIDGKPYDNGEGIKEGDGIYYRMNSSVKLDANASNHKPTSSDDNITYGFDYWFLATGSATLDSFDEEDANATIVIPKGDVKLNTSWKQKYRTTPTNCYLYDPDHSYGTDLTDQALFFAKDTTVVVYELGSSQSSKLTGFTITAVNGYGHDGETVEATEGHTYYTFKMPGYPVTVTANYSKIYQVVVNGSYEDHMEGETVSLEGKADPDTENKHFSRWKTTPEITNDANFKTGEADTSFTVTGNISVNAVYAYKVTAENGTLVNDETHKGFYEEGETVAFAADTDDKTHKLTGVTVTPVNSSDGLEFPADTDENGNYTFTMPGYPVTVTAKYNNIYTVIINGSNPQSHVEGSTIDLEGDPDDDTHKFLRWEVTKGDLSGDENFDAGEAKTSFTVHGDVTVEAVYAYKVVMEKGTLVNDETHNGFYEEGDIVSISIDLPDDAEPSTFKWSVDPPVDFVDENGNIDGKGATKTSTFFRMIGCSLNVTASWDAHDHTPSDTWASDDTHHWHTCTTCDQDVHLDEAEHTAGTELGHDETSHWNICDVCGAKMNGTTKEHEYEWKSDDDGHWEECVCGAKQDEEKADHIFGEDGNAKTCDVCGHENPDYVAPDPTPTPDPIPDTDTSSDSGSAVGAVIAGAAIGGTVLFVGYEVVTDIILGNLLPAGADTPVNRGQLAWLIWSTKGAPEPESQPAFTDVSEPEMAKAAQWCVEQGIMDAKSDSTFNPGGWVPKFKVIETWNKAFPAQN